MVVDNLVQTMVLLTSCATGTTFVTVYTPWTCKFIFCSNEERIFGKILNYQITLANRLSRALRGGQENPALENFILGETMKCLADLRRMWSQWNFVCRCKKKWVFMVVSYIVCNAFRMFESYYFMKELHEYIQFTNPIICWFYIFFMSIENVLFDDNKDFEEVQKFFVCHCGIKITVIYFVWF